MNGRRLVAVYPDASNVHLVKDIGMVANVLARSHGWKSSLLCLDRGRDFPNLSDQARWLDLVQVPDEPGYRQFRWPPKSVLRHVREHAREIDVLQLFNHTRESMTLGLAYRLANPRGFLHLKLDANESWLAGELERKKASRWTALLDFLQPHLWLKLVPDLVTAETSTSLETFARTFPWVRSKLARMPNGFDDQWLEREGLGEIRRDHKENIVLVVGRIGTEQKNTELLLEALEGLHPGDWKVVLAGPVADGFQPTIDAFLERRPDMRDALVVLGDVRDRRELYGWYRRAKIFCLTSRWEGFSLALVDALHFGCHIVSTPVSSLDDILGRGRIGKVVHDAAELAGELAAAFRGEQDPLASFDAVREHAKGFRWSGICEEFVQRVESRSGLGSRLPNR